LKLRRLIRKHIRQRIRSNIHLIWGYDGQDTYYAANGSETKESNTTNRECARGVTDIILKNKKRHSDSEVGLLPPKQKSKAFKYGCLLNYCEFS
jgi:hypothetical protein